MFLVNLTHNYLLDIHKNLDMHGVSASVGRFLVFTQLCFFFVSAWDESNTVDSFLGSL